MMLWLTNPEKEAIEDTAPWATVRFLVKTPTPIAPIAIRKSSLFTVLRPENILESMFATSETIREDKAVQLKTMAEGPIRDA